MNSISLFSSLRRVMSLELLLLVAVTLIILIPKFDFLPVAGTSTSVRIEDFVVAALYVVWLGWLVRYRQQFRLTTAHKLMLLVIAIGALSTGWGMISGSVPFKGLGILNILRRVEYFGMFWVAYSWLKPERLSYYVKFLLGMSVVVVIIDILQWLQLLPMFSTWEGYSGQVLYYQKNFSFVISTFAGHYELGGFLLLLIPVAVTLLWTVKNRWQRAGLLLLLAGYYFAMYFSFSRAAYFAMLFELIVLFVLLRKYWLILLPVADMARIILLYLQGKYSKYQYSIGVVHSTPTPKPTLEASHSAMASSAPKIKPHLPTTQNHLKLSPDTELTLDPGGATRIDVWQNALHHFYKNPVIGTGYSSIGTGADNQYLRTIAETGILGLGALLWLVGWVELRLYRASRLADGLSQVVLISLVAGIAGIMAQAILIDILDSSKVAMLLWFLVGLGLVVADSVGSSHENLDAKPGRSV